MSAYTPHFEVFVESPTGLSLPQPDRETLAQVSPTQTIEAATQAGLDLQELYGATAGARCYLHTCTHDENGKAVEECQRSILWQNV